MGALPLPPPIPAEAIGLGSSADRYLGKGQMRNWKKNSSYGYYVTSSLNEKNRKIIFAYVSEHCASSGTKNLILRGAGPIKKMFQILFFIEKNNWKLSETFHSFQNIMHHKDHIIKTAFFEGGGLSADRYPGNAQIFLHFFQFYSSTNFFFRLKMIWNVCWKNRIGSFCGERGGGFCRSLSRTGPRTVTFLALRCWILLKIKCRYRHIF